MKFAAIRSALFLCILTTTLPQSAVAEEAVKQYGIKQTTPSVGTSLTKIIVKAGTIPLNKSFDELTEEQKQTLRDQYDHMPAGDEPPFPAKGLFRFYRAVGTAHESTGLQNLGILSLNVTVDATGKATSVDVTDSPGEDITKAAVLALMNQSYKPAVCNGQPCVMQLPLRAELVGTDTSILSNANTPGVNINKTH